MTERQAWFCQACQRHHAPHVETCPGQHVAAPRGPVLPYTPYVPPAVYTVPKWPTDTLRPPFDITCATAAVKSDPSMVLVN
jgi:hypothetical protein